jgi:hypothetical protein
MRHLPLLALVLLAAPAAADVVTTTDGLVLEGTVERASDGAYVLTTPQGTVRLAAASVAAVKPGEGPRAAFLKAEAKADPKDVAAQYRLAVEAEEAGLADLARAAFERVLALAPDHAAARRALGFERVEGRWIPADEARRSRGLVLFGGAWILPAEVEAASNPGVAATRVPADEARTRSLLRSAASADPVIADAARTALAGAPEPILVKACLALLRDGAPQVRAACCRTLGEIGDEAALTPLIFSGARDNDPEVRKAAVLAAASFGHDDTAIPFVRALGSENLRLVANAAQALAVLGDQRAAGYVVKRLVSHGSSGRNFVSFLKQISYVRDYDVEIAQASNIANPEVATLQEGVILDAKVLDAAYTRTWVEPILLDALGQLVGRPIRSVAEAQRWMDEEGASVPGFPEKPSGRAPRRLPGRLLGVPMDR